MFQGFNQLIVLATLLSTGLGAFAVPTRRQGGFVIKSTGFNPNLCADAGAGSAGTGVVFAPCNGGSSQQWNLDSQGVSEQGLVFIRPVSDASLCAGTLNGNTFVTLLGANDCVPNSLTTNWFPGDSQTPAVGFLDGGCLTVDNNQGDTHPAKVQGCVVTFDLPNTAGRQHIEVLSV